SVETPLSVDLGDSISFDDDLPSVTAGDVNISNLALVTQDADTIGDNSDTDSESFEAAFLAAVTPNYGADGPGNTVAGGYSLSVTNASSGLTSNGVPIGLELDGGAVYGRAAGVDIFKISVSADGTVTLTQYAEIDHLPEDLDGVNDNANLALGAGKVLLSATVTVIDGDNDSVETPL